MVESIALRHRLHQLLQDQSPGHRGLLAEFDDFLAQSDPGRCLALWMSDCSSTGEPEDRGRRIRNQLQADIAGIDDLISESLNGILHHPKLQTVEARWRGLRFVTGHAPLRENVRIRVLDLSAADLRQDLETAIEYDRSILFRKVYDDEFGSPGGQPFGLLIADFEVTHHWTRERPEQLDPATLESLAGVSAAAFAPVVLNASPQLLGGESFQDLVRGARLEKLFQEPQYNRWRAFRGHPDARFAGLVLPRAQYRPLYRSEHLKNCEFSFSEHRTEPDGSARLWGGGTWLFAVACLQTFIRTGWYEGLVGMDGPGAIRTLPLMHEDPGEELPIFPLEVLIDEAFQRELQVHGLMPVRVSKPETVLSFPVAVSLMSLAAAGAAEKPENAVLALQLNLLLGVSRFAHYIRILARNMIGSGLGAGDLQIRLHRWLSRYVTANSGNSPLLRSKYPLSGFQVVVTERAGFPGAYFCQLSLKPHSQIHDADIQFEFLTDL